MRSPMDNGLGGKLCILDGLAQCRGDMFEGGMVRMQICIVVLGVRGSGARGLWDLDRERERLMSLRAIEFLFP